MLKKSFVVLVVCALLFALFPVTLPSSKILQVFNAVNAPDVIVRGTNGSALTIDLSFGDDPVEQWIAELEAPFPTLFIDIGWAKRFPDAVRIINKKNIPVALLGENGNVYEENTDLLPTQIKEFSSIFEKKPLWFRTKDEYFPKGLRTALWHEEINALGSTTRWRGGTPPKPLKGEIIAVSLDSKQTTSLKELDELMASREFHSIEDVLFAVTVKTKKIPK